MLDKKRRIFRLIESYMNDFRGDAVQEVYGKGSKIKIHSMSHGLSTDIILFELIIELGETINESVMNKELADVLIEDASVYFFPNHKIKSFSRFDV